MTGSVLLRGGHVVDGTGAEPIRADVAVRDGLVARVGLDAAAWADPGATRIDCAGRLVMPGLVDAHSHADAAVFEERVQLAILAQGVTTVIAGQDGVSYAPGDGTYATEYFAGLIGAHPTYNGGGVDRLLAGYDGTSPVNVAYLVPAGTVRFEVMGRTQRRATRAEVAAMQRLIVEGLEDGAVGLSTGLDYTPGMFALTEEIAALATPLAEVGGVYVTHMRGGYESNVADGVREVVAICRAAGDIPGHVSHYHAPPELALAAVAEAAAVGVDLTFDAYPYRAGCTLLAMPLLPSELCLMEPDDAVARLDDPEFAARLRNEWLPQAGTAPYLGAGWADRLTIADAGCSRFAWAGGFSLAEAAARTLQTVEGFAIDLLRESRLRATAVLSLPPGRSVEDLAALIRHPKHMAGSDGIYLGTHPHPRGWGTMTRILARYVRRRQDLTWGQAGWHLAGHPARRFALPDRGAIRSGYVADIIVVDPERLEDRATYQHPREPSTGIDDVLVAGDAVLRDGVLTGNLPGAGLRRADR